MHSDTSHNIFRLERLHYYTLKAMVEGPGPENNSYAIVEVLPDMSITVTGYRKAISKQLAPVVARVDNSI